MARNVLLCLALTALAAGAPVADGDSAATPAVPVANNATTPPVLVLTYVKDAASRNINGTSPEETAPAPEKPSALTPSPHLLLLVGAPPSINIPQESRPVQAPEYKFRNGTRVVGTTWAASFETKLTDNNVCITLKDSASPFTKEVKPEVSEGEWNTDVECDFYSRAGCHPENKLGPSGIQGKTIVKNVGPHSPVRVHDVMKFADILPATNGTAPRVKAAKCSPVAAAGAGEAAGAKVTASATATSSATEPITTPGAPAPPPKEADTWV